MVTHSMAQAVAAGRSGARDAPRAGGVRPRRRRGVSASRRTTSCSSSTSFGGPTGWTTRRPRCCGERTCSRGADAPATSGLAHKTARMLIGSIAAAQPGATYAPRHRGGRAASPACRPTLGDAFMPTTRWLQTTVLFAHLAAIFLGGGFAMATDRDTFIAVRAARLSGQIRHLGRLRTIHKPVILGLVLALVSGFLLFAADIEHFSGSAVFWVKMTPPRGPPRKRIPPQADRGDPQHRQAGLSRCSGAGSGRSRRRAWRSGWP